MLRLILDRCGEHPRTVPTFSFSPGARWYSEALLPTRFAGANGLREGSTHADAVIGHFSIRPGRVGQILLAPRAKQLSVVEAKMASGLSSRVSNARSFNQAARTVACIAHMISVADPAASDLTEVSFTIVAPQQRIDEGTFAELLTTSALIKSVRNRAQMYSGIHDSWMK